MKTYDDIQQDMSDLVDQLKARTMDLMLAREISNATGKNIKVFQLRLAEKIFLSSKACRNDNVLELEQ